MPRKSWVDKAAETGDWTAHEAKAGRELRVSGAKILASRAQRDRPERCISRVGENEAPEVDSVDLKPDRVEELVEETFLEDADPLPSDREEKALAPTVDSAPAVTLAEGYRAYLEAGGKCKLQKRVLHHLGSVPIDQIDRSAIIEAGLKLYPSCTEAERTKLVHEPLEEIVGKSMLVMTTPKMPGRFDGCAYC